MNLYLDIPSGSLFFFNDVLATKLSASLHNRRPIVSYFARYIQPFYYLFSLYIDITSSLFSKNKSTKFGSKSVPLPSSIILKQVSNGRASL